MKRSDSGKVMSQEEAKRSSGISATADLLVMHNKMHQIVFGCTSPQIGIYRLSSILQQHLFF